MIEELKFRDLEKLRLWCPYEFPNLESGLYCSQKAIFDREGNLIGSALLKLSSEAMIILDPTVCERKRANGIKEAFESLPNELEKFALEDTQVNILPITDTKYAEFLIKHFNFEKAQGISLTFRRK